jgi:hypothetical protein
MKHFLHYLAPLAAVALFALALPSLAHGAASIQGTVTDGKHGRPLMGATVSAFDARTKILAEVVHSAENGTFRVGGLVPGDYRLMITKQGYRSVEVSGLSVETADHLIIGLPIAIESAANGSEDPMQMLAHCNNLVNPDEIADVYVICGGG